MNDSQLHVIRLFAIVFMHLSTRAIAATDLCQALASQFMELSNVASALQKTRADCPKYDIQQFLDFF
jgi:hypothetical protein